MSKVTIITLVLILSILLLVVIIIKGTNQHEQEAQMPDIQTPTIQTPGNSDLYVEVEYMTKEEVIEVFYENFEVFKSVAEFVLVTGESFYFSNASNEMLLKVNGSKIDMSELQIEEQILRLVNLDFDSILGDETGTRVDFYCTHNMGLQGIIYAKNGLVEYWGYTPLEKENWYYFITIHSSPGGR